MTSLFSDFKKYSFLTPSQTTSSIPKDFNRLICQLKPWEDIPASCTKLLWDTDFFLNNEVNIIPVVLFLRREIIFNSHELNSWELKNRLKRPSLKERIRPALVNIPKWYWATPTDMPKMLHIPRKWIPGLASITLKIILRVGWLKVAFSDKLFPIVDEANGLDLAKNPENAIERNGVFLDKAVDIKENITINKSNKTKKDLTLFKVNPLRDIMFFLFYDYL